MLGKLLKYEIPSVGRKLGPLYVAWLAVSILFGLTAGRLTNSNLVTLISALVYFGVTVAVFVMAIVLIIQRYNNSLLGDEAYFNLTLPVKPGTHILSKTITSLVWTVLTMLTALLSAVLIIVSAGGLNAFWNGEPIDWAVWWNEIGKQFFTPDAILLIIELLVASVLSIVKSILAVYAAITIGHLVPKYVIPASIVAYIRKRHRRTSGIRVGATGSAGSGGRRIRGIAGAPGVRVRRHALLLGRVLLHLQIHSGEAPEPELDAAAVTDMV